MFKRRQRHPAVTPVPPSSLPPGTAAIAVFLCLILVSGLVVHIQTMPRAEKKIPKLAVGGSSPVQNPAADAGSTNDQELRAGVVGTWQDFYHGKRTMTIRPDGTATMIVELSGWKARLFTSRLRLDLAWSVEDGKLLRRTIGGDPADKVAYVNRRVGDRCAEPILQLTGDRMVLLDQNGQQQYTWSRVQ